MNYLVILALFLLVLIPAMILRYEQRKVYTAPLQIKPKRDEVTEALQILELPPSANINDVKEAHRKLIQKFHPDIGGSKILASRINRARDILIRNLMPQTKRAA